MDKLRNNIKKKFMTCPRYDTTKTMSSSRHWVFQFLEDAAKDNRKRLKTGQFRSYDNRRPNYFVLAPQNKKGRPHITGTRSWKEKEEKTKFMISLYHKRCKPTRTGPAEWKVFRVTIQKWNESSLKNCIFIGKNYDFVKWILFKVQWTLDYLFRCLAKENR